MIDIEPETPVDRLEAATSKLEEMKADSATGPWYVHQNMHGVTRIRSEELPVVAEVYDAVGFENASYTAELIVILHRTIDAQLRVLHEGKREFYRYSSLYQTDVLKAALALADTIVGDADR